MNEKAILQAVSQIEPELFWMLLKLFGVGVIVLALKGFMENIVAYIQFRIDRRLGLGVKVKIRGIEGMITDYTFSWVFITTTEGMILVAIKRWRFEQWELIDKGVEK